jgi:hypothetical protein
MLRVIRQRKSKARKQNQLESQACSLHGSDGDDMFLRQCSSRLPSRRATLFSPLTLAWSVSHTVPFVFLGPPQMLLLIVWLRLIVVTNYFQGMNL